jgi:hypothetical protein
VRQSAGFAMNYAILYDHATITHIGTTSWIHSTNTSLLVNLNGVDTDTSLDHVANYYLHESVHKTYMGCGL